MRRLFFLALALVPAAVSVAAPLHPRFTVQLNTQVSEASKETLIGDMTNAFKKLDDVSVTTDGTALWILDINVTPIMDRRGLQGYAVSTVIADQSSGQTLEGLPSQDFKTPAAEHTVKDLAKKLVTIRDHLMVTCTVDGLSKAYMQIVDYFNETYLMPVREDLDNYNFNKSESFRRKSSGKYE